MIDFASATTLLRERDRPSMLPIIGNGPPGTFVCFADCFRVSLPTDQIVFADESRGHAQVGFGGMAFVGLRDGQLTFVRAREIHPDDQLSPARSHIMRLDPAWVSAIVVEGTRVWSRQTGAETCAEKCAEKCAD